MHSSSGAGANGGFRCNLGKGYQPTASLSRRCQPQPHLCIERPPKSTGSGRRQVGVQQHMHMFGHEHIRPQLKIKFGPSLVLRIREPLAGSRGPKKRIAAKPSEGHFMRVAWLVFIACLRMRRCRVCRILSLAQGGKSKIELLRDSICSRFAWPGRRRRFTGAS